MADTDNESLVLSRHLAAPPARVFAAWTDPALIARWFTPMEVAEPVAADIDLRVGGRYRIVLRAVDGECHDVGGEYREVQPARRLVFTWAWASTPTRVSLVSVDFEAEGDGTRLTLIHARFFDRDALERHRGGWNTVLDHLVADCATAAGGAPGCP